MIFFYDALDAFLESICLTEQALHVLFTLPSTPFNESKCLSPLHRDMTESTQGFVMTT